MAFTTAVMSAAFNSPSAFTSPICDMLMVIVAASELS